MAGIGFRLKKSLTDETYTGLIKGYLFAAIIAAGPWIFSVISINALSFFISSNFSKEDFQFFNAIITYSFCFSLILFGCVDTVITRYLSDKLYFQETHMLTASFSMMWMFVLLFFSVFAIPFYYFNDISLFFKIMGYTFFLCLGSIWLCMIFLGAAKKYIPIVLGFIIGGVASYVFGKYLGTLYGLPGVFLGYLSGQFIILFILLWRVYAEFSFTPFFSIEWITYFKKFPLLILVGLFLNLGIWIDKILFWFSKEDGKQVVSLFYNDENYGSPVFIAYLTMIPVLTLFLVRIETSFYIYYKKYFNAIDTKQGLKTILKRKEELVTCIQESIPPVLQIQGFLTAVAIYFAPQIIDFFHFPSTSTAIFRIATLGVFMQSLFMITNILLLYLLEYKKVILINFIFFVTNFLFTKICFKLGFTFWGFGIFFASLIALFLSYFFLSKQLKDLEFKTFFGQPLVQPKMYKTQAWEPSETLITPQELLEEK